MEITEKSFWEKYWGDIELPKKVDFNFKNDRVIANTILDYVPKATTNQKALEVGCAPGKWMVLLYEKLGYAIDGFEYVEIAAEKTKENFLLCNIPEEKFNIVTADFLTQVPSPKYDVVTSFGFLEHFENYEEIFEKHLLYAKKGAYVVIGFPSFRGVNYWMQLFIDRMAGTKIIKNHNISMMDKDIMKGMLKSLKKESLYMEYIGGFEPALFNVNDIPNLFIRFFTKVIIKLLSLVFANSKSKYISSYLIFVVKND